MPENEVLVEEVSPNGNIMAAVEHDGQSVYFYLHGAPDTEFGLRTCWVRNLKQAPAKLDADAMRRGEQPMLPIPFCSHPQGASLPNPSTLRVVWFEEGDAAALLEDGEILAVVPSWSGLKGFEGYARDCTVENPLCWPLGSPATNAMFDRVAHAEAFWASWENGDPWSDIQKSTLDAYVRVIAPVTNYYAIDGGTWPPKALVRMEASGAVVAATCGVCIRPQPRIELYGEEAAPWRRIELGIAIDPALAGNASSLLSYVSGQTNLPWHSYTWFGSGHTIPCDSIPVGSSGTRFTAVLLCPNPPGAPAITLPPYEGDAPNLLWMIPITDGERELAMGKSSTKLARALWARGAGWVHRDRDPVA